MNRNAVRFLLLLASLLAIVLAFLGLRTLSTNFPGWFLLLTGVVYTTGTVIVAYIRGKPFREAQISALYNKERGVQRRLTATERTKDDFTKLDLEEQIKKYVAELQSEMVELIRADPQTPEERHQVFLLKKRVVDTVLEEARIDEHRKIHIKFRSDYAIHTG